LTWTQSATELSSPTSSPPVSGPPSPGSLPSASLAAPSPAAGVDHFGRARRRSPDEPGKKRGRSQQKDWNHGGRGRDNRQVERTHNSRPRNNSRDRAGSCSLFFFFHSILVDSRPSRSLSPKGPRARVGPMMSYVKFASFERPDTSPEALQRMYDIYQIQYCKDASNYFFEKNKLEEWFRERYDPLLQQNIEIESREWAISESQKIFDLAMSDPSGFLSHVCLGPLENENHDSGPTSPSLLSSHAVVSPHHFDGHHDRTIALAGIPANCTKNILSLSIRTALSTVCEDGSTFGVDRILLGQPTWVTRSAPPTFDR
jgi:hypothetical protein